MLPAVFDNREWQLGLAGCKFLTSRWAHPGGASHYKRELLTHLQAVEPGQDSPHYPDNKASTFTVSKL